MSSWRASPDTSGPRAKCETVVYEAIAKAAEIIVHARCPLPLPEKPSSSRFNLHVPEIDQVRYVIRRKVKMCCLVSKRVFYDIKHDIRAAAPHSCCQSSELSLHAFY